MRKEVLKRVSRILRFACMTAWVSVGIGCEELDDTITCLLYTSDAADEL